MRKQFSFVFAAVIAFSLVAAQPALGAGPTREPAPSDPISFTAGQVCPFPVLIEAVRNKATIKTFANGRVFVSGSFWARVTNLLSGRSITFNNSGPLTLTPNLDDGSLDIKVRGQSLLYFFPEDLDGARLLRMTGLVRETLSAGNVITAFSHPGGTTENLCDTLR